MYNCLGHPLVGIEKTRKKAQESVSVAVLRSEASRIALFMSDSNAEAHASICGQSIRPIFHKI